MLNYHVKIGLVPIRRDCTPRPGIFNWEYAEERARKTVAYIEEHFTSENVSFVDLKGINDVEVLYNEKDVQPVVDLMRKERADAIFIINSNFGNEEVAAMVTKELGLPVLLWARWTTYLSRTAAVTRTANAVCSASAARCSATAFRSAILKIAA